MNLKSKRICSVLLVLLITCIVYFPSLSNDFVNWDDPDLLLRNELVRSIDFDNIIEIFKSTVHSSYKPLTILTFAIEYRFFGYNPFAYHATNLFFHLFVVLLIFYLALRLGLSDRAAFIAALLFAIHPMHVESVAWVSERKDVLYVSFYLLAMHSYWSYLKQKRSRFYVLTFILGALSMLAKPMAFSLPVILIICDWFYKRKISSKSILEKCIFLIYIIPIGWMTAKLHTSGDDLQIIEKVLVWSWSLTFYLREFILPMTLSPRYPLPQPISFLNFHYIVSIFLLFAFLYSLIRFKNCRWFVFAGLFYFFSICLLLRTKDVYLFAVADRYMYLPSLGICFFLAFCIDQTFINGLKKKREGSRDRYPP